MSANYKELDSQNKPINSCIRVMGFVTPVALSVVLISLPLSTGSKEITHAYRL